MRLSARRIGAVFLRHFYLLTRSWPRLLDLVYWPTMQMILWGFISKYLTVQHGPAAGIAATFLTAVLLWDTLFRGQLGTSLCFLEEMYARHLGHLFMSPLRPYELVIAVFGVATVRVLIGVGGAALLAVPIHHFWIGAALGWSLLPYFAVLLMFGWAVGLIISGLVLRLGMGAESLAWAAIFLIQPLSGVYYPISTLPPPVQWISWILPAASVFEGMRGVVLHDTFDLGLFAHAVIALVAWLALAGIAFVLLFRQARDRGQLLQVGE
ncbi:MAG: ABC transporter permease [Geminicoccaceae bacterium]